MTALRRFYLKAWALLIGYWLGALAIDLWKHLA